MAKKSHLSELSSTKGVTFGRKLRAESTEAERLMWSRVRGRQLADWKFRRQVPLGRYVVDFLCGEAHLIAEFDGGQHSEAIDYDTARTNWLEVAGYRVVRFWSNDVMTNIEGVLQTLTLALSQGRGDESGT